MNNLLDEELCLFELEKIITIKKNKVRECMFWTNEVTFCGVQI